MDIIINPIGGLANRMRAIASGIALCNEHDFNLKEIIWPINSDLYCPFDKLFEPIDNIQVKSISNIKNIFLYDEPRKKNFFLSRLFQTDRYCGKILELHSNIYEYINSLNNTKKPLLIQSGGIFYDFTPEVYKNIFIPRKELINEAKQRIQSNTIGLHIRRTDNLVSIEQSPTDSFIQAINEEIKRDNTATFYLATDDDDVKQQLSSLFGNKRIIFSKLTASRKTEQGIKEAAIELLCLSMCKKILGSYWSSFSEAAALIGNVNLIKLRRING